jgi:hypothetical protein
VSGSIARDPDASRPTSGGSSDDFHVTAARTVRYPTIDVLRGVALVSMVSSHLDDLHQQTFTARILHSARWFDGAFSFVALSGLVTGLVHRRVVERRGYRASAEKLIRRSGFLFAVHIGLCLSAVALASWTFHGRVPMTPTWVEHGGIWPTTIDIVDLGLEPDYNSVLPMYVLFLLWAVVIVALLQRGWKYAAVAASLVVYAYGTTVNGEALSADGFSLANWQLLFTVGLIIGWEWEHGIPRVSRRWRVAALSGAGAISGALLLAARIDPDAVTNRFGSALAKNQGGWLAFVDAAALIVVGYAIIEHVRRTRLVARVLRPFEVLGSRGLPGYVTMVLGLLALDAAASIPRNDAVLWILVAVCGISELAATRLAIRRRRLVRPSLTIGTLRRPASAP